MAIVHLKAIPVFSVELLIFELGKHPLSLLCCFTPPPAAVLFSCSEPSSFGQPVFKEQGLGCGGTHSLPVIFSSMRLTISESQHHLQCSRKVTYKTWLNGCMRYRCILRYMYKFLLTKKWQSAAGQNNHLSLPFHFFLQKFNQQENPQLHWAVMRQKLRAVFLAVTDGLSDLKPGMQLPWDPVAVPIKQTGERYLPRAWWGGINCWNSIEVLSWKVLDTVK